MKIAFGCDHAAFEGPGEPFHDALIRHLKERGHEVVDHGTHGPGSVDYPDFANLVCASVLNKDAERGVLVCGTGIGMGIAANRHHGIRAAVVNSSGMARLGREHNDANVLCMGRRTLSLEQCCDLM